MHQTRTQTVWRIAFGLISLSLGLGIEDEGEGERGNVYTESIVQGCQFRVPFPGTRNSVQILVSRNPKPTVILFLCVFERDGVPKHVFSFILRQVTTSSWVPGNENPDRVSKDWEHYVKSLKTKIQIRFPILGNSVRVPISRNPRTWKPIVTRLQMKEKIYLNKSSGSKTHRNELSIGFKVPGNGNPKERET